MSIAPSPSGVERMFPVATDYGRFSGRAQESGDSKRRQHSLADAWAERTGIPIDLRLCDEAVSAYQHNPERLTDPDLYDLAHYLHMVQAGRVQRGDYLLLENLDRLSRQKMVPATHLLTSILMAGVVVVQLAPEELTMTAESDMFTIFRAVMELSRGHGESERKHQMCSASYADNRAAAAAGVASYQGALPAWVRRVGEGKAGHRSLELIPERAAIVRQIYSWAANGWGDILIVQRLRAEGVPSWCGRVPRLDPETGQQLRTRRGRLRWKKDGTHFGSGQWTRSYITSILAARAAAGELRTHTGEIVPIPAAVTEEEWLAARAGRTDRRHSGGRPRLVGPENLFRGLLREAGTGEHFHGFLRPLRRGQGRQQRMIINASARQGQDTGSTFPEEALEQALLQCLREIDLRTMFHPGTEPDALAVLRGRLEHVRRRLAELRVELAESDTLPKGVVQVMAQLEEEEQRLEEERRQVQHAVAHPLADALEQAQSLFDVIQTAEQRLRLRALLRRFITEIRLLIVPRGWDRLAALQMHFTGGEVRSYLILYRRDVMPSGLRASRRKRERGRDEWSVRSFVGAGVPEAIDLRQRAGTDRLRSLLTAIPLD